jgi:hypothetical protein
VWPVSWRPAPGAATRVMGESLSRLREPDLRLGLGEQSTIDARRGSVRGTAKTPAFVYHVRGFVAATLMAEFNITVDVVSDTI